MFNSQEDEILPTCHGDLKVLLCSRQSKGLLGKSVGSQQVALTGRPLTSRSHSVPAQEGSRASVWAGKGAPAPLRAQVRATTSGPLSVAG